MLILGISSFQHDAAAALMRNGAVVAAIENRKLQPTSTQRLPQEAIEFCLNHGGVEWDKLDMAAVACDPFLGWRRRAFSRSSLLQGSVFGATQRQGKEVARLSRETANFRILKERAGSATKIVPVDHQLCHAASAFFLSGFEKAMILCLDGEGDGRAGLLAIGDGNRIHVECNIPVHNSVGLVYSRFTSILGFAPSKEEHKTQWLGLEGKPIHRELLLRVLRGGDGVFPSVDHRYFSRNSSGRFKLSEDFLKELGAPGESPDLTLEQKRDLACSLQAAVTELISTLLAATQKRTGLQSICLGGGVFQNSLLVSALESRFGVGNIFVPPAPGNAGCAIGAAAWMWHQEMGHPRQPESRSVYWGPSYSRHEVKDVLDNVKARYTLQTTGEKKLESAVRLLRAGKIVGWYYGATEFGPRALGHRSIFASPWTPYVAENLNDFVKHRESFRPFAVSVREEDCARYFTASPLCRFMNSLASVRPDIDVLPSPILLEGGLVRLHIVEKEADPTLWELLRRFGENQPASILVNTSFNLPGEPPVVRPKDAIRTFFCSGLDALFVDNFLLTKASAAHVLNDPPGAVGAV
jgi:carbamoyltransferase